MCGIAGHIFAAGSRSADDARQIAERMASRLVHRGPDAQGAWEDAGAGVALAFRRLAIIDLSPAGNQPMISADKRWVLVFNGEIYNFPDLSADLVRSGVQFRGHSDTEVLLESIARWGLDRALERANGMFAFAVWDTHERALTLGRDRVGEKPLYFAKVSGGWAFGSELKALLQHPGCPSEIDRGALALFFRHGYIPAPLSIYREVRKVRPGTLVTLRYGEPPRERGYWSAKDVYEKGVREPFRGGPDEARDQVELLLRDSVRIRMHSDVPLGAMLSGGIDSSTVVALMQAQSQRRVKTFTIGFREDGYDEAAMARRVAQHLGTDHTELYLTAEDARALLPRLPELYDEPFADASQIPTFLVSRLARDQVTVCLSGDGGDELFGGYPRYALAEAAWSVVARIPSAVRPTASAFLRAIPPGPWDRLLTATAPLLPSRVSRLGTSFRRRQIAELLRCDTRRALYRQLVSVWTEPTKIVLQSEEPATALTADGIHLESFSAEMSYLDTVSYLPDDILVKLDRASMGVSLEGRVPLLDPRLLELAASLPPDFKIRHGVQKWILREVLHKYVPSELVERPKMGFGVPIGTWMAGPLAEWTRDLLAPEAVKRGGFLAVEPVADLLAAHAAGRQGTEAHLWHVAVFQAWLQARRLDN